jgi:hypothetical protein
VGLEWICLVEDRLIAFRIRPHPCLRQDFPMNGEDNGVSQARTRINPSLESPLNWLEARPGTLA